MYEIDSESEYYDVVETIAESAREHDLRSSENCKDSAESSTLGDPSSPKHVAEQCIQSTTVMGDEIALTTDAHPYAMDRLRPSDVVARSHVGTRERPLTVNEVSEFEQLSLRAQAVACLERDLIEVAEYDPE